MNVGVHRRLARLGPFGSVYTIAAALVMTVAGCTASAKGTVAGSSSTTNSHFATTTLTTVLESSAPTSPPGKTVHWLDVSFNVPIGWVVTSTSPGSPDGCAHPTNLPYGAPSWLGCAGISIGPNTSDPAHPASPANPGQVWFGSTGVLPCPYPDSRANDVVLTPGTLVDQQDQTLGGVTYRWYRWSTTCNLNGTPGTPTVRAFDAQVWWLPQAGIAFADVTGHSETTAILSSVRVDHPSNSGS